MFGVALKPKTTWQKNTATSKRIIICFFVVVVTMQISYWFHDLLALISASCHQSSVGIPDALLPNGSMFDLMEICQVTFFYFGVVIPNSMDEREKWNIWKNHSGSKQSSSRQVHSFHHEHEHDEHRRHILCSWLKSLTIFLLFCCFFPRSTKTCFRSYRVWAKLCLRTKRIFFYFPYRQRKTFWRTQCWA